MEAVEQLQPVEQERYFDSKLRLWSSRIRAEGHAEGHSEGHSEGHAEGHSEGHADGHAEALASEQARLRTQAELKFDAPTADRLAESLAGTDAPERLSEAWHWIIVCDTNDELLERISKGENARR